MKSIKFGKKHFKCKVCGSKIRGVVSHVGKEPKLCNMCFWKILGGKITVDKS